MIYPVIKRCECGLLNSLSMPFVCKCGKPEHSWQELDGKIVRLQDMSLGHLSNTIRLVAARAEKRPNEPCYEVALDLFYAELATRDLEIKQTTGIMAALERSLATPGVTE